MSKINIKFMSEVSYATLRRNIDKYSFEFKNNPKSSKWIETITSEKVFELKKFQIDDFELKIPNGPYDRKTDYENAITLYEHLHILPQYILSEPKFWLWVMFEKGYETSLKGMEKIDSTSLKHQWLFVDGLRRGLFFNVLSRLYYRVELTIAPENQDDPYYLTKYVMENPTRFREISWRTISNQKFVVKSMLKAEIRVNRELVFEEKGDYFSKLAKEICKLGSIKLIDAMDESDVEEYIYEKYYKIISTDLEKTKLDMYTKANDFIREDNEKSLIKAIKILYDLHEYKDSQNLLNECREKAKKYKQKSKFFGFLVNKKQNW